MIFMPGAPPAPGEKQKGRYDTIRETATDAVWQNHLDGKAELGIIPILDDGTCYFGAIDLDIYNLDLASVEAKIRANNLPLTVCRTKSGGAHLFLFLKEPVNAGKVRQSLGTWAIAMGFTETEIFPKQERLANDSDALGCSINMPYFHSKRTTRYAIGEKGAVSLAEFLALAKSRQITESQLDKIEVATDEVLEDGPPCLQCLAQAGFPRGTRNNAMFNLIVYCKLRYADDWKSHVDHLNRAYMNPPLESTEIAELIKTHGRKKYFYTCSQAPLIGACNKQICLTKKFGVGESDDDPGVVYGQMIKIETDPPIYLVEVDGVQIDCDADTLRNQNRFRTRCMEKTNKLPNQIKHWDKQIKKWLDNMQSIPAPPDAGRDGETWALVEEFCTGRMLAKSREEILQGHPWVQNGRTFFRGKDLRTFLTRKNYKIMPGEMWKIIYNNQGEHTNLSIRGKAISVYSVPTFTAQDSAFDIPGLDNQGEI
jgi:hypothetical protein